MHMLKLFQLNPDYAMRLERLNQIEETDARTVISGLLNPMCRLELRLERLERERPEKQAPDSQAIPRTFPTIRFNTSKTRRI